jgi:hypothetical protein
VLQMSYHNKNIYEVFSKEKQLKIIKYWRKKQTNKLLYVSFDDNINLNLP